MNQSREQQFPIATWWLLGLLIVVSLGLFGILTFWPDRFIELIGSFGVASEETLREKLNQLYVDAIILCSVAVALVFADGLARKSFGVSLVHALFFDERGPKLHHSIRKAALVASIIGMLIILDFILMGRNQEEWLYQEDGPMEWFTAVSFIIAGGVLFWTAGQQFITKNETSTSTWQIAFASVVGAALWLVAMEEISWGQRIFGLTTPEALKEVNTQDEFNLHNIFTDYFKYAYFIVALGLFATVWFAMKLWLDKSSAPWRHWLPSPVVLFLAAEILCFSFHLMFNELVEPIAAMIVLLYAFQLRDVMASQEHPEANRQVAAERLPA